MENRKLQIYVFLLVVLSFGLVSCGSSKTTVSSSSSSSSTSTKPVTECNRIQGSFIQADMEIYYSNNIAYNDTIRIRVLATDGSFDSNTSQVIQFFRWKANYTGVTYIDSTPLQVRMESATLGVILDTTYYDKISLNTIKTFAAKYAISGSSAIDYLKKINFVITGLDTDYNVLRVGLYDGSSTTATASTDSLIPAFYANPDDYAIDPSGNDRAPVLRALHPFASMAGQGWSSSSFETEAKSYCFDPYTATPTSSN